MIIKNLSVKKIKCNENGFILCDYAGTNTVSFFAELPKSAVVDHVKVDGVFVEDITAKKNITSHMEIYEKISHSGKECKCAMTVEFTDELPEIFNKLANYQIQEFEVYYHLEAFFEV